jgi:RecB family exonuclease
VEVAGSGATQWRHARQLERFKPQSLARDGHVGAELGANRAAEGLSVRDLEKLSGCPQQFLFAGLMKLDPLPREPDPLDLRRDRLGSLIHGVLDDVQVEFREEMASPMAQELGPRMVERAQVLLHERWQRDARSLAPGIAVMHRLWEEQWAGALAEGIRADLGILEDENRAPAQIEFELRETLEFSRPGGPQVSLELTGRPDRLDRFAAGQRCVLDFKTGRKPAVLADPKAILSGRQLQLVLYGMMLESTDGSDPVSLEVRPLHPAALDEIGPRLEIPSDYTHGPHRQAMHETLAVLVELLLQGATIANVDNGPCAFCDFRLACRRLHPPSAERVRRTQMPEVQRYLALAGKSKRKPLLAAEEGA